MMRRFYIIFSLIFLTTCDDGDIITVDLEFDQELDLCTNNTDSFLIYDLREDPNESLSLIIPRSTDQEFPFTEATPTDMPTEFSINASTNRFIYRTYNRAVGNTELCDPVPPADLTIVEDYEANAGTAFATVTVEDDDNDGIPNEFEYGPGGIDDPRNSDENSDNPDDIPDYLDQDDDNDNVLTINELNDEDEDEDPTTNPLDTDDDGIPDYLDTDDDGDGIPTILEDQSNTKNPRNSANLNENNDGDLVYHYLNTLEVTAYDDLGLIGGNTYTRTVTVSFLITDFNLDILSATELDLGTLTYSFTIIEEEEED